MTQKIGIVGLGNMGLPMAATLAKAGNAVAATDATPERRALWGDTDADAPALARRCDVLILSLPSSRQVESVCAGLADAARPGSLIVDTSTAEPESSRMLQRQFAARGIGFVDAPVSGGAAGAANGQLLAMLGGEAADVARASEILRPLTRKIVACGGPGAGNVVKLINNLLCAAHLALAGEALALADAGGVAAEILLEALNAGSGRSAVTEVNLPRWVNSGTFDSGFTMALMRKDVRLAATLEGGGAIAQAAASVWAASAAALADAEDFNRIVPWTRTGAV